MIVKRRAQSAGLINDQTTIKNNPEYPFQRKPKSRRPLDTDFHRYGDEYTGYLTR